MDEKNTLPPGKYVVAVSGGVDSVVLLDVLAKHKNLELIVAHFDHGIREDSAKDADFVKQLAGKYGLTFEMAQGKLGSEVSEADAREKRYNFLRQTMEKYDARAIVTAHHQDDVIETSILNICRGTGRRGLSSLKSRHDIARPFLHIPKSELKKYAEDNDLIWHEDSTNADPKYLRNYVRLNVVQKMNNETRAKWLQILQNMDQVNNKLDAEIEQILRHGLHKGQLVLSRKWFIMLPHSIAKEVLMSILDKLNAQDIDKKTIERITVQIKTLPHGKTLQAVGVDVYLTKRSARFKKR
ncbi:MAG TPA: tRNA lysidine(34) synthetase TilS [Patescibacteria group bacterium]|nr:tRNA lysidine(34) synthetase TilS [Patescibacteria group bacterium]